ncbi:polysaccharide deacetylase family sporulation protein PdaB [Desulfonispora thiosulfatigenes DSM 11270]|uniref:Polysaccharide deacetylase family sporulation protein PdaB n=1 Tax=Desulfonispora thiosulfatigenes DSM 11270 TaxID=656914 RepID=A0A1W1VIK3_DESTI|nr:polysaccharide deacetylase family protein [Desulfonispora thiosulfatigenes]SMB92774.1 polysaccharide deacetylase family sporulation protein PdaB [Desulfonispora thiosulfatigenes DSM 11270]
MRKKYLIIALGLLLITSFVYGKSFSKLNNFDLAGGSEQVNREFPQRQIVDLVSLFPDTFFRQMATKEKKIALTFDDGPDNYYTVQILDVLKRENIPATFFVIGQRCNDNPEVVKRIHDEGHILGNHSFSHPNFLKLTPEKIIKELNGTDEKINNLAGYKPAFFRSPYGSLDADKLKLVASQGYKIIAWNVDSLDWQGLSASEVKNNILSNTIEGSIVLQHSAGGKGEDLSGTVTALSEIITTLKKQGYEFVTVDKLLNLPYKK